MNTLFKAFNDQYEDRFVASLEAITSMIEGLEDNEYKNYFIDAGTFALKMGALYQDMGPEFFDGKSMGELVDHNRSLYEGMIGDQYETSFASTEYSVNQYGLEVGQVLAFIYSSIRQSVVAVYEQQLVTITAFNELLVEAQQAISKGNSDQLASLLEAKMTEDIEVKIELAMFRRTNPDFDVYRNIIETADLSDNKYLYRYGKFIGENELKTADFLRNQPEETIKLMADTYTEAFVKGYTNDRKEMPLEEKKTINLGYQLGFERVERLALKNFEVVGLKSLIYDDVFVAARNRMVYTKHSKQYAYDHRHDMALYFTDAYADAYEAAYEKVITRNGDAYKYLAGPAVQESFGEPGFSPLSRDNNIVYSDTQTKRKTQFDTNLGKLMNTFLPKSIRSFVIIAYPLPSIGEKYEEIFGEIIKVNTLDSDLYANIQSKIIDALDQGEYVHVKGLGDNKTDITVAMCAIKDADKETIFANCVAEVNVPVGEVYTSPKLTGTNGKLHVSQVFLNGLKYENIELDFVDGFITEYSSSNFGEDTEANRQFVHENLIHPHKTLPLGEFAIGTNTTAYVMAEKYGIAQLLPILIAEKMGPHFAIGDTCFSWAEDVSVYNPDGKEIIARENEMSCKRTEDVSKAYTFKHTDITIPYDELDFIDVIKADGSRISLIKEGRFVLTGTDVLNKPFDQ